MSDVTRVKLRRPRFEQVALVVVLGSVRAYYLARDLGDRAWLGVKRRVVR